MLIVIMLVCFALSVVVPYKAMSAVIYSHFNVWSQSHKTFFGPKFAHSIVEALSFHNTVTNIVFINETV